MDNKEAVNWLINISADIGKAEHSDLWHYEQALTEIKDMLESAQPVATNTNVGDKINRQAVIDELRRFKPEIIPYEKARIYVEETVKTMYDRVVELPTIQPEPTDEQVEEYCKRRCLHVVTDDFFRIAQPEPQWIPCEDCKRRCKRWENLKTLQE